MRKWQKRLPEEGWEGLKGRSHRSHRLVRRLLAYVRQAVKETRSELEAQVT